jgi:futalosine hydrolase
MNIIVAASTILEIEPLIETPHLPLHKLLITGVGAAATIYALTKQVLQEKPDLVIQAGVAGTFMQDGLGRVFVVKEDRFADLGVEENGKWRDVFDMGLAHPDESPFHNGWLKNENSFIRELNLPLATSITNNEITTNKSRINLLRSKYQPSLESMEGAAHHFVCLQEKVPFIQIRAVSNIVGERDKSKWQMREAIENLNIALTNILQGIGAKMQSA